MPSKEGMRVVLWMCFTTNLIITTVYYLLSFFVFYKLSQASTEVSWNTPSNGTEVIGKIFTKAPPAIWRAPMAATLLGALLLLGFNLFTCVVLLKKSINRSGPGFSYGFLCAFCFTLSTFCLLCGIILNGFQSVVKNSLEGPSYSSWTSTSTQTFYGAEAFAFITFAELLLFFIALVVFQGAVSDQLGIGKKDANSAYNPLEGTPIMLTPQQPVGGYSDRAGNGFGEPPPQYNAYNNNAYNGYNNSNGAVASSGYSQTSNHGHLQPQQRYNSQQHLNHGNGQYSDAAQDGGYGADEYAPQASQQGAAQLGGFQAGYGTATYATGYGSEYQGEGQAPASGGFQQGRGAGAQGPAGGYYGEQQRL